MGPELVLLAAAASYRPWGDTALDEARLRQLPVLLIVSGDGEPQEGDPGLAGFLPVLVDPLERPDVADLYHTAATLLPGSPELPPGPAMFLLTPEGRPFAAAPVHGTSLAGFLGRGASEFFEHRSEVEAKAGTVLALLRESQQGEPARGPLGADTPARALQGLTDAMDPVHGGFHVTPKTPPHGALRLLIEEVQRTGDAEALRMLVATLGGMARGAVLNPGMGFSRQAATAGWGEPGSQQRLSDNALLLRAYAVAHVLTGEARYREVADQVVSFCLRELRDEEGTFIAARDDAWDLAAHDERVVAGWNGLMISGLAASGRKADLAAAETAARGILRRLGPAALLRRFGRGEELGGSALLEDYAYLAEGLLDLGEATGEPRWNDEAAALLAVATSRFLDADRGGFFDTDERHGSLPVRIRNGYDGELPSANGVMASALLKLSRATGEARHAAMARRTIEAFLGDLQRAPRGLETLAAAAGELLGRGGAPAAPDTALPSRVARGPVTVEATIAPSRARPGEALEARVILTVAAGHRVNGRSAGKDLVGLSVSVPGEDFVASPPRYPEPAPAHTGRVTVTVPLRVRPGRAAGNARVRVRVLFQACDAVDCAAPDDALLDAPVTILAPGR
jgi:uncharacterized protein YyaL (SSP411 family)